LISENRLQDRISLLGRREDIPRIMNALDLVVLSSCGEAFPNVVAEAMACGVAGVAARSGALPELVEDGTSGLLVPPRDATALADAIQKLAGDERLRREMAQRGLERVRRKFTVPGSIENVVKVYESIWSS